MRLTQHMNIPFQVPPAHPFNPLLALRTATAIESDQDRFVYVDNMLKRCWGLGEDLANKSSIQRLIEESNLGHLDLIQKAQTDDVKEQLRLNTEQAVHDYGVFGVPSMSVIDDSEDPNSRKELFWGNDSVSLLDEYLFGGMRVDEAKLEQFLNHPRGSDRKAYRERSKNQ